MARVIGAKSVTTNYEVQVKKPIDARALVPSYEALITKSNWVKSGTTQVIAYNGMIVAVADTSDTSKNGIYFLFDPNCVSAMKSPNVEDESNWHKIAEASEISLLTERLSSIEASLTNITDDISDLDARITALEEDSDVEVFGYRSGFPAQGVANKLYVAADEEKSYVWVNNDYLPVGGESTQPEIIFGGTAD